MKHRRRTWFDVAVRIAVFGFCLFAEAQESTKIPTLGYLASGSAGTTQSSIEPFRKGLRELGYVEGKNIRIEYRYADGQTERLSSLAKELVRIPVAIIITQGGSQPVQAAKQA